MAIPGHLRNRYSRQSAFLPIGNKGQGKLREGCVVIIGCGALGGQIANIMVRAGVGTVKIVDRDFVEYHNLQRQILFNEDDIKDKTPKAVAAERYLRKVNSSVKVQGIVADANSANVERLVDGADIILDGLDNMETRFLINDVSLKHKVPWVYGGAIASVGMTMTIIPGQTACLRCAFPGLDGSVELATCETAGIVGTVPAIIGSLQATEAIKILVGDKGISRGLLFIDVWENDFLRLTVEPSDECPACHGKYEALQAQFEIKTTSLCGQTRAVQVVNARAKAIDFRELASRLEMMGPVSFNEFALRFRAQDKEIIVFRDGRALIQGTIDEALAKELYLRYVFSDPP